MAAIKYDIAKPLLSDKEPNASFVSDSPDSSSRHRRLPQQNIAIIIHALVFLTTLLLAGTTIHLNAKHAQKHCKSDLVPSHSKLPFSACDSNMLKLRTQTLLQIKSDTQRSQLLRITGTMSFSGASRAPKQKLRGTTGWEVSRSPPTIVSF